MLITPQSRPNRRWSVLAVLCVSLLIIVVDTTIVNITLPSLMRQLHASVSDVQWVVDAYTVVFAGLLMLAGTLADRYGRRRCLLLALVVFAVASTAAAVSHGVTELVLARTVMGGAAAFIMPSTLSILANVFTDEHERALAIGIWSGVVGIGVVLGPLVGGALLDHFWWGSVFVVNVPVALTAIIAAVALVPESRDLDAVQVDWPGAVLSVAALVALVTAIIEAPNQGWSNLKVLGLFAIAAAATTGFVKWERQAQRPMLDLEFFRNPRLTAATATITLVFFGLMGFVFLSTQYLQFVLGYSPFRAGLGTLPFAAAMMSLAPFSPRFVEWLGTKRVVLVGLGAFTGGLLIATRITVASGYPRLGVAMALLGTGLAFTSAPATDAIMNALPRNRAGVGSALNDTARELGGAIGVAVVGSIVSTMYRADVIRNIPAGTPRPVAAAAHESLATALYASGRMGSAGAQLADTARAAFVTGMAHATLAAAAIGGVAAFVAFRWLPDAPAEPFTDVEALPPQESESARLVA
jgi:EmrB/QacA subfamily drug resistance transporter